MREQDTIYQPQYEVSLNDPPEILRDGLVSYVIDGWETQRMEEEKHGGHMWNRFFFDFEFGSMAAKLLNKESGEKNRLEEIIKTSIADLVSYGNPQEMVNIYQFWWPVVKTLPFITIDQFETQWKAGIHKITHPLGFIQALESYTEVTGKPIDDETINQRIASTTRDMLVSLPPY